MCAAPEKKHDLKLRNTIWGLGAFFIIYLYGRGHDIIMFQSWEALHRVVGWLLPGRHGSRAQEQPFVNKATRQPGKQAGEWAGGQAGRQRCVLGISMVPPCLAISVPIYEVGFDRSLK